MLGQLYYIHFSPDYVTVRNVTKGTEVTHEPVVAVANNRLLAVGMQAHDALRQVPGTVLLTPFAGDRVVVSDMEAAQSLLALMVKQLASRFEWVKPQVLLQYRGPLPQPLSSLEIRALHELGESVGARKVFILQETQRFPDAALLNPNMLKILK